MQIYGKTLNFSYVGSNEKTDVYHVQFTIKIKLYGNEHATKVCSVRRQSRSDNVCRSNTNTLWCASLTKEINDLLRYNLSLSFITY